MPLQRFKLLNDVTMHRPESLIVIQRTADREHLPYRPNTDAAALQACASYEGPLVMQYA
jgi:hypothetical protein